MRGVVVTPGEGQSARLEDVRDPVREPDECLVRVLEVGIDGTDREIDAGEYGAAPPGADHLVLGHECVGEVVEAPRGGTLAAGDLVVATVRRPCPEMCINCGAGEFDFCRTGNYRERGIKERHGYLADMYAERPEFLVRIPRELRELGVLVEPVSIVEKALRQIDAMQRRMRWEPARAVITGGGAIGTLAALILRLRGIEVVIYSRGAAQGAAADIFHTIGAEYADSEEVDLTDVARRFGPPDIALEATGYSPLAWECAEALAINGIACLLSVTGGDLEVDIPSDLLNRRLVLNNQVIFGSVNSSCGDFQDAVRDIGALRERFPGTIDRFITHRRPIEEFRAALDEEDPGELKTVVGIGTHAG